MLPLTKQKMKMKSDQSEEMSQNEEMNQTAEMNQKKANTSFIKTTVLILLPIFVFAGCLLIPDIYFSNQDNKTFGAINHQNLEAVDLTISSDISLADKLFIISHAEDYSFVDLNFDYNDAFSYNDVRNMAVEELLEMLGYLNLPFYEDGIYEAFIDKYMVSYTRDPKLNFVVWNVDIRYFGFPMRVILDYETSSILYFSFDLRASMNTWHSAEEFQALSYYKTALLPFLDFLKADQSDDNTAHLDALVEAFSNMLSEYYGYTVSLSDVISTATEDDKLPSGITDEAYKDSAMEAYEFSSTDYLFSYNLSGRGSTDSPLYYQIEENNRLMIFNSYTYSTTTIH